MNDTKEIMDTPENFKRLIILVNEYSKSLGMCCKILQAVDKNEEQFPGSVGFLLAQSVKEFAKEYELMAAYKEKMLELNPYSNKVH